MLLPRPPAGDHDLSSHFSSDYKNKKEEEDWGFKSILKKHLRLFVCIKGQVIVYLLPDEHVHNVVNLLCELATSRSRQKGITICLHIFHQITKIRKRRRRIEGSNTFWKSIFLNMHLCFDKIMKHLLEQSRLLEIHQLIFFLNFSWFSHLDWLNDTET